MKSYIAIITNDDDSAFGLHFPDLPGCTAAGESQDEVMANAAIALRLWAEDRDEPLPTPSSMAELSKHSDVRSDLSAGGIALVVPLITAGRKQRLNVMLDPSVIEATDLAAQAAGVSRSRFIERTLQSELAREIGAASLEKSSTRVARKKKSGTA